MTTCSSRLGWFALLSAVQLACGGKETPPAASAELLAGIPVMPGARAMSTAAGSDAVQEGYLAARPADSVASWYRQWFLKDGWKITGDLRAANGMVTLHAEKGARPLWLIIQPAADGLGSRFSVIGAEADTSGPRGPRN